MLTLVNYSVSLCFGYLALPCNIISSKTILAKVFKLFRLSTLRHYTSSKDSFLHAQLEIKSVSSSTQHYASSLTRHCLPTTKGWLQSWTVAFVSMTGITDPH